MAKTKSAPTCNYKGCLKKRKPSHNGNGGWSSFCYFHVNKATINSFLSRLYTSISRRVRGKSTNRPDLYKGLPVMSRETFVSWAKNHPDFLKLYKQWKTSDFDRRLTPTVNRMNSKRGYTLDNVEWLTNSQNCGLSASVRQAKNKKAIYELLGVKN